MIILAVWGLATERNLSIEVGGGREKRERKGRGKVSNLEGREEEERDWGGPKGGVDEKMLSQGRRGFACCTVAVLGAKALFLLLRVLWWGSGLGHFWLDREWHRHMWQGRFVAAL